jgi:hypothetical protein
MKIGKTIIQIYAGLSMLMTVLSFLVVVGIGAVFGGFLGAGTELSGLALSGLVGLGVGIFAVIAAVTLYIDWNLFNFKDWARKIWLLFAAIGLLMSFSLWSLVINGFLGYLMFIDKDTEKAFK